jgi:cell shape-determining protein MreC
MSTPVSEIMKKFRDDIALARELMPTMAAKDTELIELEQLLNETERLERENAELRKDKKRLEHLLKATHHTRDDIDAVMEPKP